VARVNRAAIAPLVIARALGMIFSSMKVALSWLKEHVDWDWTTEVLVDRLTLSGTEVEAVHRTGFDRDGIVTARILSFTKHPNADRLSVCQVDDGSGQPRQIVCGAKNFKEGDVVPLALPGAVMPGGFEIKDSKLRGERSSGMMCSAKELGLAEDAEGLLILDPAQAPGVPVKELFRGETVLELEVTPNRADLLSHRGLARELVALGAIAKPAAAIPALPPATQTGAWKVAVADASVSPRYTCLLLEGVKVGPSPEWLRRRLESIGLRPVNNVVDVTNFVLFDLGQPLHAFDADKLSGDTLQVRRAGEAEPFHALNGKTYALQSEDLVIADANGPVALAGVMGGEATGVTAATTRVLLESARFRAADVRRTSRRLQLLSDSSHRFERGIDPALVDVALARAAQLLVELAEARWVGGPVESAPVATASRTVPLSGSSVRRVLGFELSAERTAAILGGLGLEAEGDGWRVPSYRPDLEREIDLIEEIARIEGMDKAPSRIPGGVAVQTAADRRYHLERVLKDHLSALGFHEMSSNSLLPAEPVPAADAVRILNPLNADNVWVRPTLLASLLPAVRHNLGRGVEHIRGFEIGAVSRIKDGHPLEERRLLVVWVGDERSAHWAEPARAVDYFSLSGLIGALRRKFPALSQPVFSGPVPAATARAQGIKVPVYAAEFVLPEDWTGKEITYQALPAFPGVKRDLSFVVDRGVTQEQVSGAIRRAGVKELESVECFDLFEDSTGVKLPAEKKALAYALTYRSAERTLTEKDVVAWEQAILTSVAEAAGGRLRQ
jgi:phenylalanyl-tRNA synthetase beta chain